MLSVVIPSKNEIFLKNTILDILKNSRGDIEVFPVCQGYKPPEEEIVIDPRVHYLYMPAVSFSTKRQAVNLALKEHAKGEYFCWMDGHCGVSPSWDLQLIADSKPNRIQIPRRNRLDWDTWGIQKQSDERPPIDMEYTMWKPLINGDGIHNFKWDAKTLELLNEPLHDAFCVQASFFFMEREWFLKHDLMNPEGYEGWGAENESVAWETLYQGGEVKINKRNGLFYLHGHKGHRFGRMYFLSKKENRRSYAFSYNRWVIERKDFFCNLIERFMPLPGWPDTWKEQLYK